MRKYCCSVTQLKYLLKEYHRITRDIDSFQHRRLCGDRNEPFFPNSTFKPLFNGSNNKRFAYFKIFFRVMCTDETSLDDTAIYI